MRLVLGDHHLDPFGGERVVDRRRRRRARPWQAPERREIVCHCELVTRSEIEAALAGPLPAATLGGLKRRTRVMMGGCQGFYCGARVAALAGPRLGLAAAPAPLHG